MYLNQNPNLFVNEKRITVILLNVFLCFIPIIGQKTDTLTCAQVQPSPSFSYKGIRETGEACKAYFAKHLIIPKELMDDSIEGKIYIQFVVEKNGKLSDIKLIRGVCPVMDAMALEVVRKMPRWKPAQQDDKPIRTYFAIAVKWGYPK